MPAIPMKFPEEDMVFISKSDRLLGDGESGGSKSIYDQCAAMRRRRNQVYAGAKPSRLTPQERAWASTADLSRTSTRPASRAAAASPASRMVSRVL